MQPKRPGASAWIALLVIGSLVLATPLLGGAQTARAQEEEYDVRFALESWAELNMQMQEGDTIVWSAATDDQQEVYLDLHSHDGSQEVYHERFDSTTNEAGEFTAEQDGVYSIYLQNDMEEDVTVRLQARGDFEIDSELNIEPLDDTNGAPGPGALLVLMAVAMVGGVYCRRGRNASPSR